MTRTRTIIYVACASFGLFALAGAGKAQEYFGPEATGVDVADPGTSTGSFGNAPSVSQEGRGNGPALEKLLPSGQGQRPESLSENERQRLAPLTTPIQQARTPEAAIEAYARGLAAEPECVLLEQVYLRRMIELGTPHLAEAQAEDLVRRNQEDGLAWAVLAYTSGEANDTSAALAEIATALSYKPDDDFVQQTAGKLIAWYDVLGKPEEITDEQLKQALADIRKDFQNRPVFAQAYNAARTAYAQGAGVPPSAADEAQPVPRTENAPQPTVRNTSPSYADEENLSDDDGMDETGVPAPADDGYTTIRSGDDEALGFGFGYGTSPGYVTSPYAYSPYGYTYSTGYYGYLYPPCTSTIIVPRAHCYVMRDRPVHRYLHFRIGHREHDYGATRQRLDLHGRGPLGSRNLSLGVAGRSGSDRSGITRHSGSRFGGLRFYNPSAPTRFGAEPWRYGMDGSSLRDRQGNRGGDSRLGPRAPVSGTRSWPSGVRRTPTSRRDDRPGSSDRTPLGVRSGPPRPTRPQGTTWPGVRRTTPAPAAGPRSAPSAPRVGRPVGPPAPTRGHRVAPPTPRQPQQPPQQPGGRRR